MSTPTPTQVAMNVREAEVERLVSDFKRRISELQLAILSGKLTGAELDKAGEELATARRQLLLNLEAQMKEQTGRRVRQKEQDRQDRTA